MESHGILSQFRDGPLDDIMTRIPAPLGYGRDPLNEVEQESLDPPDFSSLQASVWNDAVDQLGPSGEHLDRINTEIATLKEELADEQAEHQRILERAEESLRVAVRERFPKADPSEHEAFVDWVIKFLGRLGPSTVEKSTEPPRLWQEVQNPEKWRAFARHFTGRKRSISMIEFRLAVYKAIRKVRAHSKEVIKLPDPDKIRAQALHLLSLSPDSQEEKGVSADPLEGGRANKIPSDTFVRKRQVRHAEYIVEVYEDVWSEVDSITDLKREVLAAELKSKTMEEAVTSRVEMTQTALREAGVDYEDGNPHDFFWVLQVAIKKYYEAQDQKEEQ